MFKTELLKRGVNGFLTMNGESRCATRCAMAKLYPFPERPAGGGRTSTQGRGMLVALKGVQLERTIETVAFLRSLPDQSYLDRFNRARPVEDDRSAERHRARFPDERW